MHDTALPTILYHYEDTLAEESESSSKGRHAPTRQAGLSEMLCVVGRLLLRKVLTSYQSSLEEEQNQQLLVRLVLSHFQAQALERQALSNMELLLEEDANAPKVASKRKLKKDRKLKRQAETGEGEAAAEAAQWDEQAELTLLAQMGWSKCVGSTCQACVDTEGVENSRVENGAVANGALENEAVENGAQCSAQTESAPSSPADERGGGGGASGGAAAAAQLRRDFLGGDERLELTSEEWRWWEAKKAELLEKRQLMRACLKQRFEDFCDRYAQPLFPHAPWTRTPKVCLPIGGC